MTPTVEVPESAAGVVGALSPGAVVIAGGTQVMPRINTEAHDIDTLVSLRHAGLDVARRLPQASARPRRTVTTAWSTD